MNQNAKSYKLLSFDLKGYLGRRFKSNERNWLHNAMASNPSMMGFFDIRDSDPKAMVPWFGEFPGKILTSLSLTYEMTRDADTYAEAEKYVSELSRVIGDDGYLGPHPKERRMDGETHPELAGRKSMDKLWDVWGHYHCILGLLMWYRVSQNELALNTALAAANFVYLYFTGSGRRYITAGASEMNLAISHVFAELYNEVGDTRYLEAAKHIVLDEWREDDAGNYMEDALAGLDFFQMRRPRWESLHDILTLAELYRIDGDRRYLDAFTRIWRSIAKTDIHNHGGFSSGEGAVGDPFDTRPVETCCTVAWAAMTTEYLKLTLDPRAADELELSVYNAIPGSLMDGDRLYTYNTPMEGIKEPSTKSISFQSVPGGMELNCCQVNGARGFAQIGQWGVFCRHDAEQGAQNAAPDSIYVSFYGPCEVSLLTNSGNVISIIQDTEYPVEGKIQLEIHPKLEEEFAFFLRIPNWSNQSTIKVNGVTVEYETKPGTYACIRRVWKAGDTVELSLDMQIRYLRGERGLSGRTSVYYGPVLLAYNPGEDHSCGVQEDVDNDDAVNADVNNDDARHDDTGHDDTGPKPSCALPEITASAFNDVKISRGGDKNILYADVADLSGGRIRLVDYAGCGRNGSWFTTWLNVQG